MNKPNSSKRRRRVMALIIVAVVLSPIALMAFFVDDWSRDLSTNHAWTDPAAADPLMRPLLVALSPDEVDASLTRLVEQVPAWTDCQADAPLPEDAKLRDLGVDAARVWRLVRRTPIMQYRDDIWVIAETATEGATRLHFESRSRVGKGDLGQNPRNLRELRAWFEKN